MWSSRRDLRVLAYHGVEDGQRFADQLDWLCTYLSPVSLDQVRRALLNGDPLPEGAVLLTFDDGETSVLDVAAPLLSERGVPAVAFVVVSLIGTDLPFWWVEVEELQRRGAVTPSSRSNLVREMKEMPDFRRRRLMEELRGQVREPVRTPQLSSDDLRKLELDNIAIGNHSLTHPCLDMCDDDTLSREVGQSHEILTDLLGHQPVAFAYPNGNWDPRVRRVVANAGHDVAFSFNHRLVEPGADPLSISRIRVDSSAGLDRFRILASGLHSKAHRMRGGS